MSDTATAKKVVVPGDAVLKLPEAGEVYVGEGLYEREGNIVTVKCGVVRQTGSGRHWIEGRAKRYFPTVDDVVIGIVVDKHSESWTVDINAANNAVLPLLSFENATKRNRPNVGVGDVVYCRVVECHRDMDAVLAATDAAGRAAGFGLLKEGMVFPCSTLLARQLLKKPAHGVLEALAQHVAFEVAVGMNGRVWVRADGSAATIVVAEQLKKSEQWSDAQAKIVVDAVFSRLNKPRAS